jgi:hypothetical protein
MPEVLTPHLSLPLPHPSHSLDADVLRIRDAFTAIDQKIAALDTLLSSDDLTLDTLQELVTAIKSARGEIGVLKEVVDEQVASMLGSVNARFSALDGTIVSHAAALEAKQERLVSGDSIKTIGGASILGDGDLCVTHGLNFLTGVI